MAPGRGPHPGTSSLPGDSSGATPCLSPPPLSLRPTPTGRRGHAGRSGSCRSDLAADCRHLCPSCLHGQAGPAPARGLTHTHSLLPSWVDLEGPPHLHPGTGLPLHHLPPWAGSRGAPDVGTCQLGRGAPRFRPEMGQNERLSQKESGGPHPAIASPDLVTPWDTGGHPGPAHSPSWPQGHIVTATAEPSGLPRAILPMGTC